MKFSKQRELIEQTVKQNVTHPTADDVYSKLKPLNPCLSLGTVYRNLNFLAEKGTIRKLSMPNGSDRFDGELYDHHHIVCSECGKIFDIKLDIMNNISKKIKEETGTIVTSHQLIINGLCAECVKS